MCKTGTDAAVIAMAVSYGVTDEDMIESVANSVAWGYSDKLASPITLKHIIVDEFAKRGILMV